MLILIKAIIHARLLSKVFSISIYHKALVNPYFKIKKEINKINMFSLFVGDLFLVSAL